MSVSKYSQQIRIPSCYQPHNVQDVQERMAKRRSSRELKAVSICINGEEKVDERKQPSKSKRVFHSLKSHWQEFCTNTSLHGFQYLGESHRSLAERIWWVLSISISFTACAILISNTYRKWENSPVIVSFAETSTPVWQIPFPAVTICSEIKVKRSAFNYTNAMWAVKEENYTAEQMEEYQYSSILCNWIPIKNGSLTLNYDKTYDYIDKVSPRLHECLSRCIWRGKDTPCESLFTPILTDDGLCYIFNLVGSQELLKEQDSEMENESNETDSKASRNWSLETGYTKGAKDVYPLRTHSSGSGAGLTLRYFADDTEVDPLCRWPVAGFRVLLHSPVDYPQVSHQFFRAPLNRDVVVGVRPSMMNTSEGLRSYPSARRQCLLSSERQLRFFRIYTQKNCEFECLTNYTMQLCNCTTFFMPYSENVSICGAGSKLCVDDVMVFLVNDNASAQKCACMPACTEIKYDVETSQSHFEWHKILEAMKVEPNVSRHHTARLGQISIYFKEMQFIPSRRSELYGITDFMANCGGLLGLFVGFSFLSLVEFFYFFTIRLCANLRKKRRTKRSTA